MNKEELWPKQGKTKKGILILLVVIVAALLITLLEEKTGFKHTKKIPLVIALLCIGIWLYQPAKKEKV